MQGYIKIDRSILQHPALQKRDRKFCEIGAWLWLLLEASFKERDFTIGTQTTRLKRGELCHSVSYISAVWNWESHRVRYYLDKLVKFNCILIIKDNSKSADFPNIIKILNYDHYQDPISKPDVKLINNNHNKGNNKGIEYIGEFNEIWQKLKARRGSKKVAYQKWSKIRDKVDPNILVSEYNKTVHKASSIEFIPHFSTFISQERWLDEDKIIKEKKMTHEDWFRSRFPDILDKDWTMLSYSYPEIVFINRKGNKLAYDMRDGTPIS